MRPWLGNALQNWSFVKGTHQTPSQRVSNAELARSLQLRHNRHDSVSNHQSYDCLLNRLFRRRSKKTSKLRLTGLCAGNSPGTGEFTAHMASNAENVSIWWRHHVLFFSLDKLSNKLGCAMPWRPCYVTIMITWLWYLLINVNSACRSSVPRSLRTLQK